MAPLGAWGPPMWVGKSGMKSFLTPRRGFRPNFLNIVIFIQKPSQNASPCNFRPWPLKMATTPRSKIKTGMGVVFFGKNVFRPGGANLGSENAEKRYFLRFGCAARAGSARGLRDPAPHCKK